jgi:hypothetical protein
MTLKEFKLWLEGFTEAVNEIPSRTQWELLLNKIKLIQPDKLNIKDIKEYSPKDFPPLYETPTCGNVHNHAIKEWAEVNKNLFKSNNNGIPIAHIGRLKS